MFLRDLLHITVVSAANVLHVRLGDIPCQGQKKCMYCIYFIICKGEKA